MGTLAQLCNKLNLVFLCTSLFHYSKYLPENHEANILQKRPANKIIFLWGYTLGSNYPFQDPYNSRT